MTLTKSIALSFDARATLERRVLPLAVTLLLWAVLLDGAHLVAQVL